MTKPVQGWERGKFVRAQVVVREELLRRALLFGIEPLVFPDAYLYCGKTLIGRTDEAGLVGSFGLDWPRWATDMCDVGLWSRWALVRLPERVGRLAYGVVGPDGEAFVDGLQFAPASAVVFAREVLKRAEADG